MWRVIHYIILSIIIIGIAQFMYSSLKDLNSNTITPHEFNSQTYEREKILLHYKEEERENNALEEYVKSKINVLKES